MHILTITKTIYFYIQPYPKIPRCGANPWIFRNWWEDNWLHDIYLPFNAVYYFYNVTVSNYGGLDRASSSKDPRYELRYVR